MPYDGLRPESKGTDMSEWIVQIVLWLLAAVAFVALWMVWQERDT